MIDDPMAPEVVAARARAVGEKVVLECWPKAVRELFYAAARARRGLDTVRTRHSRSCPACLRWEQDRSFCPAEQLLNAAWWRAHLLEEAYRFVLGLPPRLTSANDYGQLATWETLGDGR